jgi:hypothetical protein
MTTTIPVNVRTVRGRRPEWDVYVGRGRCPCGWATCTHGPTGFGNPLPGRPLVEYVQHLARGL